MRFLAIYGAAVFFCGGVAYGGLVGGPASLTVLAQKSDIIVVATIQSITDSPQGDAVQLVVHGVLQGAPGTLQLAAVLPQPAPMSPNEVFVASGLLPRSWVGRSGVWFLQTGSPYYQILPTALGGYGAAGVRHKKV